MAVVLNLQRVSRSFGRVRAITELDLEVEKATVTVIVGPNGAGKTTTLRLATGVLAPDAGSVSVFGLDPAIDGGEVRRRCGVVPPKPAMYDRLTGRDNLAFAAALYDLSDPPIDQLAKRFGIAGVLDERVAGYSTGMRTRLALARSLLHDPELLLLDEPTAGLDPESARAVRELIISTAREGKTVVMSTHLLHEAEGTADRIVLMSEGRSFEAGTPAELAARYWDGVRVRLDAEDRAGLRASTSRMGVSRVADHEAVIVRLAGLEELPDLVARLVAEGVRLTRVEPLVPTLERLYFEMRGRTEEP